MVQPMKDRVLLAAVLGLAMYLIAAELVPSTGIGGAFHRVLALALPLALLGGTVGLAIVLSRRGRPRRAALVGLAAAAGLAGSGLHLLRTRFPRNLLGSPAAYAKAARLLLGREILLGDYQPRPTLVVANRPVPRARYPAIDVHVHLADLGSGLAPERLVATMDSVGVESVVNLDFTPNHWDGFLEAFVRRYPGRFIPFATLRPWQPDALNFVENQTAWLEKAILVGARGIHLGRALGLEYRDAAGTLIAVDDPRFDFVWTLAGELGLPVLMHTGDPVAFFQPIDRHNERYGELYRHPDRSLYGPGAPSLDSLMAQRERLLRRHPRTVFIGAQVGSNASNLRYAAYLLDTYPNYYADISSAVGELGRQPRTAREFFLRYQDRLLFGTDAGAGPGGGASLDGADRSLAKFYRTHFQFLETGSEYFDQPLAESANAAAWKIYGLDLPDSVLAKIYAGNARRLIPDGAAVQARLRRLRRAAPEAAGAACAGRSYRWARWGRERPTPLGGDSAEVARADFAGDSVKLTSFSFRPGRHREIVAHGLVVNGSRSMIELRGFRVEYLGAGGTIVGSSSCRVRLGYEHCGLASVNLRAPGYIALSADTLPVAPPEARVDTARVFWTYCVPP